MTENNLHILLNKLQQVQSNIINAIAWDSYDLIHQNNKSSLIAAISSIEHSSFEIYNLLVKQINDGTLVVSGTKDPDNNTSGNDVYTLNFTLDNLFKIVMTFTIIRDCDAWISDDVNVEVAWLTIDKPQSQYIELLHRALLDSADEIAISVALSDGSDVSYSFEDTPKFTEIDQGLLQVLSNSLNKPDNTDIKYFLVKIRVVNGEDSSIAMSLVAAENANIAQDYALALESGEFNLEWDRNGAVKPCGYPRYDYYNCTPVNPHELNTFKQIHELYEANTVELIKNGNWAEFNS